MTNLAVFDFDRTVVNDDSDATIINRLREKQPPPEWEAGNNDWTPYMNDVFEHAYSAGLSPDELLSCIGSMRANPGIEELLRALHSAGWDVVILTDANTVFVKHWLQENQLSDCITKIITNGAYFKDGRLYIEPCMNQCVCSRCPTNLCKSVAMAKYCAQRGYERVVYIGDGRNDYCPAVNLPEHAIVFPRKGFPLDDLIKKTLASPDPQVSARVVPWSDGYTILREIFPGRDAVILL